MTTKLNKIVMEEIKKLSEDEVALLAIIGEEYDSLTEASVDKVKNDLLKAIDALKKNLVLYKKAKDSGNEKDTEKYKKSALLLTKAKKKLESDLDKAIGGLYADAELQMEKIKGADGKACWKGYRYAGTKNGKDKCVKEGKLTEAKDRKLAKLFQQSLKASVKDGEDKLYKLSQAWEDWNVDNDDKYDDLVDPLFAAIELVQDAGEPGKNNVVKDKEYYSYIKSADKHLKQFNKDVKKAIKGLKESVVNEAKLKKGDHVESMGEIGIVNKVKGQVAYVKFDSNPKSFHPILVSSVKYKGKHKGKDLYSESVNEANISWTTLHNDNAKAAKYKGYTSKAFKEINDAMFNFRHSMGIKTLTNKDMKLKKKVDSLHQAIFSLQKEMKKDGLTEATATLNKKDVNYQLSIDYSGNTKPKITKFNKKGITVFYGYKVNPKDVIKSLNKLEPSIKIKHKGWSVNSSGGGTHSFIFEGKLNETTAKQTLTNAINALMKTLGGRKLDKGYVKDYLKSMEKIARKNPGTFVKDYGEFDVSDWLEDVRYNLQNEGKLTEDYSQRARNFRVALRRRLDAMKKGKKIKYGKLAWTALGNGNFKDSRGRTVPGQDIVQDLKFAVQGDIMQHRGAAGDDMVDAYLKFEGKLTEGGGKKVSKNMWKKMSDDEKHNALLTVVKDPDEAEEYIESKWSDLPSGFERDMYTESVNEATSVWKHLDAKWKLQDTVMDLEYDMKMITKDLSQLHKDMEQEAEPQGGKVADRYSRDIEKKEKEYKKKKAEFKKLMAKLDRMEQF